MKCYRNFSGLFCMNVLSMTSFLRFYNPTIVFQQANDLNSVHTSQSLNEPFFRAMEGFSKGNTNVTPQKIFFSPDARGTRSGYNIPHNYALSTGVIRSNSYLITK